MKNWQKKWVFLSVLAFSFLKMEAQTSFAVIYQDSLEAFVEEVFFEKNEDFQEIQDLKVFLFKENVKFYTQEHKELLIGCNFDSENVPNYKKLYYDFFVNEMGAIGICPQFCHFFQKCKKWQLIISCL